jgi:hypothetical protein
MFNDFELKVKEDSNWELHYIHVFKGIFISPSENEYKKGNKTPLNEENEYILEEVKEQDFK